MKTKIIIITLNLLTWSFSSSANTSKTTQQESAGLTHLIVKKVDGHFIEDQGQASAELIQGQYGIFTIMFPQHDFFLQKNKKQLQLQYHQMSLNWQLNKEGLLDSLSHLEVDDLNIELEKGKLFHFQIKKLNLEIEEDLQQFDQVNINCQSNSNKNETINPMYPCLTRGHLSISVFKLNEQSEKAITRTLGLDNLLLSDLPPDPPRAGKLERFENIQMNITNNRFEASFKAIPVTSFTIKIRGDIHYLEAQKQLTLKINKANVGWVSIKSRLLEEIKEANLKNVQVIGDTIFIQL